VLADEPGAALLLVGAVGAVVLEIAHLLGEHAAASVLALEAGVDGAALFVFAICAEIAAIAQLVWRDEVAVLAVARGRAALLVATVCARLCAREEGPRACS
jgi:hypothetical protein